MPIITVEIVVSPEDTLPRRLAARLADAAAQVLGSPPGSTWVRLRRLPLEDYAENQGENRADDGMHTGLVIRPVFVSVLLADWPVRDASPSGGLPEPDPMETLAATLVKTFAGICGRHVENVHILFEPPGRGRVAFGGKIVR